MINVPNWDAVKVRYEDFWQRKNKTPLIYTGCMKDGAIIDEELYKVDKETMLFDPHYHVKTFRADFNNTFYALDGYPYVSPSLGNDLTTAILGFDIIYNEASAWVVHKDEPLSSFTDFTLDRNNWYYKKMYEMLSVYAQDAGKDYIVGTVDLNTLMDGAASMIGAENLCYEIVDNPDEVKRVLRDSLQLFKEIYTDYQSLLCDKYNVGCTNWLGLYSEKPWYFISNDFTVMISKADFDEFAMESLQECVTFLGRSFYHLDGENARVHLDRILEIPDLTGVQVQATPFVHTAEFWINDVKKIQAAGKNVIIEAKDLDDLMKLLQNVSPVGLFVRTFFENEYKTKKAEEVINNFYKGY